MFALIARRSVLACWLGLGVLVLAGCQTDSESSSADDPTGLGAEIADIVAETRDILKGVSDQATAEEAQEGLAILNGRLDSVVARVSGLGADARETIAEAVDAGLPIVRRALDRAMDAPDTADAIRPLVEQIIDKLAALAA